MATSSKVSSKFFRVATEGNTADGRKIERQWLKDIADTYNPETFGARISMEHIKGLLPDSPFKAYGDVTAVKTEEIVINGEKKLVLLAQIDPTQDLIAMNKARQKIYTSIEIAPNFAETGKAYLAGLAVTDNPASLGTEMLQFSAKAENDPLAARKQHKDNIFTAAEETTIEFEESQQPSGGETLLSKVMAYIASKGKTDEARFTDIGKAVEALAENQKDLMEKFGADMPQFAQLKTELEKSNTALENLRAEFNALKTQLASEDGDQQHRQHATGYNGMVKTDC